MKEQPDENSILFDLDNTIYNQFGTYNRAMQQKFPQIQMVTHPMTNYLIRNSTPLVACQGLRGVFRVGYHIEEEPFSGAIRQVAELSRDYDIWFVSSPNEKYHILQSRFEKSLQLLRDFGSLYEKSVFTADKSKVKGKLLVDDHPQLDAEQRTAQWEGIIVEQVYNMQSPITKRVKPCELEKIREFIE